MIYGQVRLVRKYYTSIFNLFVKMASVLPIGRDKPVGLLCCLTIHETTNSYHRNGIGIPV